jgi:hypothetical protein
MNGPEPMDGFERQLARALRRVDAPEEMLASVLSAAAAEERSRTTPNRTTQSRTTRSRIRAWTLGSRGTGLWGLSRSNTWAAGALAAMLLLGAFTGEQVHARHQREQAQLAQQQFATALRVTDQALEQTREQLARAGLRFAD